MCILYLSGFKELVATGTKALQGGRNEIENKSKTKLNCKYLLIKREVLFYKNSVTMKKYWNILILNDKKITIKDDLRKKAIRGNKYKKERSLLM